MSSTNLDETVKKSCTQRALNPWLLIIIFKEPAWRLEKYVLIIYV